MENRPNHQEKDHPSSCSSSCNGGGGGGVAALTHHPKPITRSEINACPTTFIQADTSSFKQVVQMLTGSSETTTKQGIIKSTDPPPPPSKTAIPPIKTGPKKPGSKLHERRNSFKNLNISPLFPGFQNGYCLSNAAGLISPRKPEILSPSVLNFPSLALSPVTPLIADPFNRSPTTTTTADQAALAEERAIAEKGFYLHPSPVTTPRESEPQLLPLFPLTSPKVSSGR